MGCSLWNLLILDWTGVVPFAWGHFFQGYLPGFVVAFLLDMLLVGPLAKTIAFAILHKVKAHDKRWAKILAISGTMALFMVTFMSLYGLVYNGQSVTLSSYGRAWFDKCYHGLTTKFFSSWSHLTFYLGKTAKTLAW